MMATSYKPSPLSYGSPRASPFRRPESPMSPSPLRQTTPTPLPSKTMATATTPSRLANTSTPTEKSGSWTPRGLTPVTRQREPSPTRGANASPRNGDMLTTSRANVDNASALSKLQLAQVRELREGFQILDRDSDGQVGRDDVADMLAQLGMPSNPSDVTSFFPPSTSQTVTLPAYLNSLASLLSSLSPSSELLDAFSAFDEDDSGQIDVAELRSTLLHTPPELGEKPLTERELDNVMNGFTGRKAFSKHASGMGKRGEVFKYQEFVANIAGGASNNGKERGEDA